MEKKYILVGMHNRRLAFEFMNSVIRSLDSESVKITYIDNYRHQLKTDHTEVWFVSPDYWPDRLLGIRADAIFGIPYDFLMARARPNALIAERDRVGLVDYICKVERETKNRITELDRWAVYISLCLHIKQHHIPATMDMGPRDSKLIIKHLYREDTAIIIWDEVKDVIKLIETVKKHLDTWVSDKKVWITTNNPYCYCDDMRGGYTYAKPEFRVEHVCDKDIREMYPKTMIMAGRQNGKSLYRHVLNAVYGKSPTEANYMTQMAIYAALMKGENNMNNVMHDIPMNKPTYLVTENGQLPVKIDNVKIAIGEPIEFGGCVASLNENHVRNSMPTKRYFDLTIPELDMLTMRNRHGVPGIKNVYFNEPVTVVIWKDGTKTVVRCNNDQYDPEKGLAMAIAKKALGTNKSGSNYYDAFKKWLPKTEEPEETNVEEQK